MRMYFNEFVESKFTKLVEEKLDLIESGKLQEDKVLKDIIDFINKKIQGVNKEVDWDALIKNLQERNNKTCCNKESTLKLSRSKKT